MLKRLNGLVKSRGQACRKALVCSDYMGEGELSSDRCEESAQVRERCGAKLSKSKRKGERCSAAKPNGHPTGGRLGNARRQNWRKALVCSSFTREREIIAIKVAQVRVRHHDFVPEPFGSPTTLFDALEKFTRVMPSHAYAHPTEITSVCGVSSRLDRAWVSTTIGFPSRLSAQHPYSIISGSFGRFYPR